MTSNSSQTLTQYIVCYWMGWCLISLIKSLFYVNKLVISHQILHCASHCKSFTRRLTVMKCSRLEQSQALIHAFMWWEHEYHRRSICTSGSELNSAGGWDLLRGWQRSVLKKRRLQIVKDFSVLNTWLWLLNQVPVGKNIDTQNH